ncbi:P pilus assembly chaperone PapD [Klebsiella oxytoca]|uniref:P pilus assembly chaperone PapD n=1 Tax=Klebsiella oxytoca TaxID=571 RepID=A0A318FP35_KLEOX|nr:molecular chaperone [Klebsiella oxytoca]PXW39526.1 P pilus assembly chaperone PapD [Klebsiella oxytoca]
MTRYVFTFLISVCIPFTNASVVIDGTRVIFPSGRKEVSIRVTNSGDMPSLTQVWVDGGTIQNNTGKDLAPFVVLPPIIRVEPGKGQSYRLIYSGTALPQDRESLYWFNMLDIPPEPKNSQDGNYLQLSIRSRIKLFYRPITLKGNVSEAPKSLIWRFHKENNTLSVNNPSPWHVTIDSITINGNKQSAGMVAPFSTMSINSKERALKTMPSKFSFTTINDYGAVVTHNYPQ